MRVRGQELLELGRAALRELEARHQIGHVSGQAAAEHDRHVIARDQLVESVQRAPQLRPERDDQFSESERKKRWS